MKKIEGTKLVVRKVNGKADEEVKFVEVEGKKYVDDGTGKPKVDDKGEKVLFVEKKPDVPPDLKVGEADLETLAKVNPHLAKLLSDVAARDKADADRKAAEDEKARKDAEAKGEWQKLAEGEKSRANAAEEKVKNLEGMVGKYKQTIEAILKNVLAGIPKEKLALIPADYSERQKLEYIVANASILGAPSVLGKGGGVPKNDETPAGTEVEKMITRFEELQKKGSARLPMEDKEMWELAGKIKEARKAK